MKQYEVFKDGQGHIVRTETGYYAGELRLLAKETACGIPIPGQFPWDSFEESDKHCGKCEQIIELRPDLGW